MEEGLLSASAPTPMDIGDSQADAATVMQQVLQMEIGVVQNAVESFDQSITPLPTVQVPYVEACARMLTHACGQLQLKIHGSKRTGEDATWEASVNLQDQADSSRQAVLARLSLYLLHKRGRLTKVHKEPGRLNMDADLCLSEHFQFKRDKKVFLEKTFQLQKFKVVTGLCCGSDPEFGARVLQGLAPELEELSVNGVGIAHLEILLAMPRLRRLEIRYADRAIRCDDLGPFQWDDNCDVSDAKVRNDLQDTTRPWRFRTVPRSGMGLVWLKVQLPRQLLLPFVALHRETLRELILCADLPGKPEDDFLDWQNGWLWVCNDLPERLSELMERYPFESLRRLELNRHHGYWGDQVARCQQQLRDVRAVLGPGVEVRCNRCG